MILYPFSWQHTIIPVLPQSLWEIVDTPTPLVCGVLSAEVVNDYEIKNVRVQLKLRHKLIPFFLGHCGRFG